MLSAFIGLGLLLQAEPAQAAQALAAPVQAAPAAPVATPAAAPASGSTAHLPAGTVLVVELTAPLSSTTSKLGDKFTLKLSAPVTQNGVELVAIGAAGEGEVIDAARSGMGGKPGKLILSARRLDLNGHTVRIRGMTLMAGGKDRVDIATGMLLVPYVGLAAGLVKGGEVELPAGTRYTVKLAEDVDIQINSSNHSEGKNQ